jgi:hypothetical protein
MMKNKRDILNKIVEESDPKDSIYYLRGFVAKVGAKNLKTEDMDLLVELYGPEIVAYDEYYAYYSIAASNESSLTMKWWTYAIGIMTFVMMVATVAMWLK